MRIPRQPSPVQNVIDQKQPQNVEYFSYLGSMITDDRRRTRRIKTRFCFAKAIFNKENIFFGKLDLNLRT